MIKHKFFKYIASFTLLLINNYSISQEFSTNEVCGKYRFTVNWMVFIETEIKIKRNGHYSMFETFENHENQSFGSWKIVGDTLVLTPDIPLDGPLSTQRRMPLWIDNKGFVQLGNFQRFHQKRRR